ncbi:MAG: prepilin-type N-terminal cleavage/methylation domain-containing protein [Planctomycetota bacterium]|nr:prepilin-type N-terminal cleavage/methylation domain-containing protein [Planctomycetota bacterium]
MQASRRGFTVIEVIIVVAIIGVLMAIVIGLSWDAREKAKVTTCQANLSQIGKAILSYASLNRGFLPGGQPGNEYTNSTGLVTSLLPYRHIIPFIVETEGVDIEMLASSFPPDVFHCPSDDDIFGSQYEDGVGYKTSYLYNTVELTSGTYIDPDEEYGVVSPNSSARARPRPRSFFEHHENWSNGINEPINQEVCIDWTPYDEAETLTAYRHYKKLGPLKEGSNVLFLDGHVEFVPANPVDIEFEDGFEFFKDAEPNDPNVENRYWIRWIARKYWI